MPRPSRPWFRFYVEAFADRKLRREKPEHRWLFAACLGAARQSPESGRLMVGDDRMLLADLADFAGMAERQVKEGIKRLIASGMVAEDERGWFVPSFESRQFESDDVTKRTRKHRSKERSNDVPGNAPETEAETETELVTSSAAAKTAPERQRRLADAAAIIGERAALRPGTRDPIATAKAVARSVIRDRHQDAYAALLTSPHLSAHELAHLLEPGPHATPTRPALPPIHAPEAIADLTPPTTPHIDAEHADIARQALAALRRKDPAA